MKLPTKVPPVRLALAVQRIRDHLLRLHQALAPAPAVMGEFITAAWMAQSITVAADLRIADALAEKPLGIDELASRVECDPDALSRLLRALIGRGIFKQLGDGRYDLTPLAQTLRWDAPDSMAALASFIGSPQDREHWSHCVDAIRTGESVVPKLRGMEGFDWFASDPEVFDVFNQAMTNFSELAVAPVTAAYDFSGYRTIVDVGGGHGRLLAGILATAPTAKGILFDLPDVVAGAGPLLRKHNVADRVRVAEGSFFDSAPEGCDLYVMKNIIHDWPDDRAQQILKTVRGAARDGATLLLVECVIPPHDRDFVAKWSDLGMLVDNTGRERTADEYRDLLHHTGFQMTRVVPTASLFSIVEAKAASLTVDFATIFDTSKIVLNRPGCEGGEGTNTAALMAAFSRFVHPGALQARLDTDGPMVDSPQGLKAHPALPELRQQRIALARLVAALGLPTGLVEDQPKRQRRSARGVYDISGGQS